MLEDERAVLLVHVLVEAPVRRASAPSTLSLEADAENEADASAVAMPDWPECVARPPFGCGNLSDARTIVVPARAALAQRWTLQLDGFGRSTRQHRRAALAQRWTLQLDGFGSGTRQRRLGPGIGRRRDQLSLRARGWGWCSGGERIVVRLGPQGHICARERDGNRHQSNPARERLFR